MPTAIEYAVVTHWPAQNGSAGGPPVQNLMLAGDGTSSAVPLHLSSASPVDGWLLGGLPAVLLLAVLGMVWRRRVPAG